MVSLEGTHHTFVADISSSTAVGELMNNIRAKFGGQVPSIVVCAAGNLHQGLIIDMTEEHFDSLVASHLKVKQLTLTLRACRCLIYQDHDHDYILKFVY